MAKEKPKEKKEPTEKGTPMEEEEQEPQVRMVMTASGYLRPERSVRCSSCLKRITIPERASRATCPYCDMQFRISWVTPDQPRIRGPVWEALPPPGPWPKGWPGELDDEGRPLKAVKKGGKQ